MKTSVLIVEDEGLIALDLKKKVEQVGYAVPMIADNSVDAIEGVERLRPSLVLMDIRLRGPKDGIETADIIRKRFHLPVMFVTAHADRETLERARITEPFGYIVKPFHGVDFRAQIEIALWKHKMEERLRVSEAWLSSTVKNVADALIATDSKGNIAFMNGPASTLTGWSWSDAKGKPLLDVFQVFDEATGLPVVHPLDAIYDGRELGTEQRTLKLTRRGSEESILVEAGLSANHAEGTLLGIIVAFRDVTERRRAEDQNRQLEKMNALTLMAIGLGRELAESQRRIDDSVAQLIAQSQGQGSTLRLLEDVYKRSAYQKSVMQQLIMLEGRGTTEKGLVQMNNFLRGLEAKFAKALGMRRSLKLNLGNDIPPIKADPEELRENLLRLVIEARHAMPDGGEVEISTSTGDARGGKRKVEVTIRDTGKGIRGSAKERVFDPYYQSRPGNQNPGFSLFLVYQFVVLSGGSIEVSSVPGEGTAFRLSFPAAVTLNLSATA